MMAQTDPLKWPPGETSELDIEEELTLFVVAHCLHNPIRIIVAPLRRCLHDGGELASFQWRDGPMPWCFNLLYPLFHASLPEPSYDPGHGSLVLHRYSFVIVDWTTVSVGERLSTTPPGKERLKAR